MKRKKVLGIGYQNFPSTWIYSLLTSCFLVFFACFAFFGAFYNGFNIFYALFGLLFAYVAVDYAIQAWLWFRVRKKVGTLYKIGIEREIESNQEARRMIRKLFHRSQK